MIKPELIDVRRYDAATDEAFLYRRWLESYKYSSYFAKRIKPHIFFNGHRKIIDHLLKKSSVKTIIAHPKDDADTILGFLTFEEPEHENEADTQNRSTIHFVYVKEPYRRMGVARRLFHFANIDLDKVLFTHWTFSVDELFQRFSEMTYDPYKL